MANALQAASEIEARRQHCSNIHNQQKQMCSATSILGINRSNAAESDDVNRKFSSPMISPERSQSSSLNDKMDNKFTEEAQDRDLLEGWTMTKVSFFVARNSTNNDMN